MLKEVGFWRETPTLNRDASSSWSERSLLLLYKRTASSEQQQQPSKDDDHDQDDDDDNDPSRPDPTKLVDYRWFITHSHLIKMLEWYLVAGACVESHELAYSHCRFRKCAIATQTPKVLGACTLTDGSYVWPEGYWHYIHSHHVRPPQEFLDHVTTNYRRALFARKALSREFGDDVLWLWEPALKKPVPMPSGMQEWVLANTTLQLSNDPHGKATGPPIEKKSGFYYQTWDHLANTAPSCCQCTIS